MNYQQIEQKWKNEKHTITIKAFVCPCGGNIVDIGSAGCSHNDDYTYFGQCIKCKNVFSKDNGSFRGDDMELLGWKLVLEQ